MPQTGNTKIRKPRRSQKVQVDPAATDNLIGFFALLLEIDMRLRPEDYRAAQHDDYA
jgi:hypothetical protein